MKKIAELQTNKPDWYIDLVESFYLYFHVGIQANSRMKIEINDSPQTLEEAYQIIRHL